MLHRPQIIGASRPASAPGLPPRVARILSHRLEPGEKLLWNGPARLWSARVRYWGRMSAGVAAAMLVLEQIAKARELGLDAYIRDVLPDTASGTVIVMLFAWLFIHMHQGMHYIVTNRGAALYRPVMGASFAFAKGADGRRRWQTDYGDDAYDPLFFLPLGPEAAVAVDGEDIVWSGLADGETYDGIGADMVAIFADLTVDVFSRWKVRGDAHTAARRINRELARLRD